MSYGQIMFRLVAVIYLSRKLCRRLAEVGAATAPAARSLITAGIDLQRSQPFQPWHIAGNQRLLFAPRPAFQLTLARQG
jgi:hypothetical protein